jgi:hypothetical protein
MLVIHLRCSVCVLAFAVPSFAVVAVPFLCRSNTRLSG